MGRPNLNKVPVKITVNKEVLEAVREVIPNLSHPHSEEFSVGPPRFELGSPAPQAERITRLPYGPSLEN